MRQHLLKRTIAVLLAFLAYQAAELIAILPGSLHLAYATMSGVILVILLFSFLIGWLWRMQRRFQAGMQPPDATTPAFSWAKIRGALPGIVIMIVVQVIGSIMVNRGIVPNSGNEVAIDDLMRSSRVVMLLIVNVAAPLVEELIFRGLLMNVAFKERNRFSDIFNIILSTVAFAIVHGPTNLFDFVIYAGLGFALALTYVRTRDVRYGMVMHIINNLVASL
ncbi:CPBP family intramembrane glutamic endopeptidase [Lacticaseibacillus zhaodongensis]|uniref:CPBP family intramembrane glutamic endopeptidase n=1 Tax=Lacticaseibacillus zhaodongensis TaxID=2668065 RepID=UPI0012D36201|nr:type II CAAX endopeptidase family protein [Lacticaseibacillus zhaodongensis]